MKRIPLTILLLFIYTTAFATDFQTGYQNGKEAGKDIANELGNKKAVNDKIAEPLTSNNTPMETFGGGGVSFDAQLTSESSHEFLEIFAAPGTSGGIGTLIVKIDTDMDGSFDYTYKPTFPISGVCSNGVISCLPGTWEACKYYKWVAPTGPEVELSLVADIKTLAGCYCINNSCGSNLVWHNMGHVLNGIGGGVSSIIQNNNPKLLITNTSTTDTTIKYYGQEVEKLGEKIQTGSGTYFSGTAEPEQLYSTSSDTLTPKGEQERTNQDTSPLSYYSGVEQAYDYRNNPVEVENCVINRRVYINTSNNPVITIQETCSDIDTGICDPETEEICDYYGENCINTVWDGALTGLTPLPQSTTVVSPSSIAWNFTADGNSISYTNPFDTGTVVSGVNMWWTIKREYICKTTNDYNAADEINLTNSVSDSVTYSSNASKEMTYQDSSGNMTVEIQATEDVTNCEVACRVVTPAQNLQSGASANTWDYNNQTDEEITRYKSCIENNCPVEDGETIITDCQCLNDFGEAASMMQTMEAVAKDMICSQD